MANDDIADCRGAGMKNRGIPSASFANGWKTKCLEKKLHLIYPPLAGLILVIQDVILIWGEI
jgi:hypothetical protein